MPDADHEEFERLIREAEAQDRAGRTWGADPPVGYADLGLSDKVHWDLAGHVYVNDVRACCARWVSRLWHGLTGGHR